MKMIRKRPFVRRNPTALAYLVDLLSRTFLLKAVIVASRIDIPSQMRSALPLEFHSYCRNSLGTQYAQHNHSANLVEVCEGTLTFVELYPDRHIERGIRPRSASHLMVLENSLIQERVTVHRLSATWHPAAESMITAETALWEQRNMDEVGCARKTKEGTTISRGSVQT